MVKSVVVPKMFDFLYHIYINFQNNFSEADFSRSYEHSKQNTFYPQLKYCVQSNLPECE